MKISMSCFLCERPPQPTSGLWSSRPFESLDPFSGEWIVK